MTEPEDDEDRPAQGVSAQEGFPTFQHGPWTIEGEIERFGAFGRGASKVHGPRRWLAVFLVLSIVGGAIIGIVQIIV